MSTGREPMMLQRLLAEGIGSLLLAAAVLRRELIVRDALAYVPIQIIGCCASAYLGLVIGKLLFVDRTEIPKAAAAHRTLSTESRVT